MGILLSLKIAVSEGLDCGIGGVFFVWGFHISGAFLKSALIFQFKVLNL